MKKVVTFGEIMLRLSPEGYQRFVKADTYKAYYGGAEANSAETAAELGIPTEFVTKLPANGLGDAAISALRSFGVNTDHTARGGSRIGIYYLEAGTKQRPAMTIYDRAGSSMAEASASDFDWDEIFEGADWFQFSGITPALSDEMADAVYTACTKAHEKGLTVSCDLNYRAKMWSPEKAREVMNRILPLVDIFIANDKDVLGIYDDHTFRETDTRKRAEEIEQFMTDKFGFREASVILVVSDEGKGKGTWSSLLKDGKFYSSKTYYMDMIESVGGGDTYAGALIAAEKLGMGPKEAIDFASSASALKFSVPGDANIINVNEVKSLVGRSQDDWIAR